MELENVGERSFISQVGERQSNIETVPRILQEGHCSFTIQKGMESDSSVEDSDESSPDTLNKTSHKETIVKLDLRTYHQESILLQNVSPDSSEEDSDESAADTCNITSKEELIVKLNLTAYYPEKISLQDVMEKSESHSELCLENLPWIILWKLITLDRRGISTTIDDLPIENLEQDIPSLFLQTYDEHHPLDVFLTTFASCDLNLRQILSEKMFQCRLAVPFILPGIEDDQLTYCLWALRGIVPVWRNVKDEAVECSLVSQRVHVVSCLRLKHPDISKSIFLNNIMSDQECSTFYHQDCPHGDVTKVLSNGLIEASFFLPNGKKTDNLDHVAMYLNLRGDGTQLDRQVSVLSILSGVLIVCLDISNLNDEDVIKTMRTIHDANCQVILVLTNRDDRPPKMVHDAIQKYAQIFPKAWKGNVKIVFTYESQQGKKCTKKNISQLKGETRKELKSIVSKQMGLLLAEATSLVQKKRILIDEDNKSCLKGKGLAQRVLACLGNHPKKSSILPLQGNDWKEWCRLSKKKKRSRKDGLTMVGRIEKRMTEHRKNQEKVCENLNPLVDSFIAGIEACIDTPAIDYYLQWLQMNLSDLSRNRLPSLQRDYFHELHRFKAAANTQNTHSSGYTESQLRLEKAKERLEDAVFGPEHLLREMGQIYEATKDSKNMKCQRRFRHLPLYAAKLLLKGYSLEILDGDAAGVPLVWLEAVFSHLESLVGRKKKLFCISVLGIQSSGKSTLLNTMFGLQFPVSAGRCTKGVYMQLRKVPDGSDLPFDYAVVFDTEGLRAPERGESYIDHDNELATFVTGLGNVTIMNIKGENVAEIKDVLQIVSHAFLRLEMVDKCLNKDRSCIFVHQNVPATDAKEKMAQGTQTFVETLDKMTAEAADLENMAGIHTFEQVIKFDRNKHIFYAPDLWLRNPPMASVNPDYHEEVQNIQKAVWTLPRKTTFNFGVSDTFNFMKDMWNGVQNENFIFGFRNSLVTKAYNSLEDEYARLKWELENSIMEWLAQFQIQKYKTQRDLEIACSEFRTETTIEVKSKVAKLIKQLCKFIDTSPQRAFMDDWRAEKCVALQHASDACQRNVQMEIGEMQKKQEVYILNEGDQDTTKIKILKRAKDLAGKLKGRDESILAHEFQLLWKNLSVDLTVLDSKKDAPIKNQLSAELHTNIQSQTALLVKILEANPLSEETTIDTLVESISPANISDDELSMRKERRYMFWSSHVKCTPKHKTEAARIIDEIFCEVQNSLQTAKKRTSGFQIQDARSVIRTIRDRVDDHNLHRKSEFSIPTNLEVRILLQAMRYALGVFLGIQDNYERFHSASAKLKAYKEMTWNLFKQMVEQAEKEVIAAKTLWKVLEHPLRDIIKGKLQRALGSEVVFKFFTKLKLIKSILQDLAERGEYHRYKSYINNPKLYVYNWLVEHMDDSAFHEKSGKSWYVSQAERFLDRILDNILHCMKEAIQQTIASGCQQDKMGFLTDKFSDQISSLLVFPIEEYQSIVGKDVNDLLHLYGEFRKQSEDIRPDILACFKLETRETIQWNDQKPYDVVMDALWGCEATCPFCREPCQKSDPDHASQTDCHECIQHRPVAVNGRYWDETKLLNIKNCSYLVQTETGFGCKESKHDSKGNPYRKYYLPNWTILPSPDMDSSNYWMWFVCTFQEEMEKHFGKKMTKIPQNWKCITRTMAIASLEMYDH